jgi:hypothetical protein
MRNGSSAIFIYDGVLRSLELWDYKTIYKKVFLNS